MLSTVRTHGICSSRESWGLCLLSVLAFQIRCHRSGYMTSQMFGELFTAIQLLLSSEKPGIQFRKIVGALREINLTHAELKGFISTNYVPISMSFQPVTNTDLNNQKVFSV